MAAGSVLVAEDERNLAEALTFLMQRAGLDVTVARDGPSTVETARRIITRYDTVVSAKAAFAAESVPLESKKQ